jgi:hypothetical protein
VGIVTHQAASQTRAGCGTGFEDCGATVELGSGFRGDDERCVVRRVGFIKQAIESGISEKPTVVDGGTIAMADLTANVRFGGKRHDDRTGGAWPGLNFVPGDLIAEEVVC